MEIFKKVDIIVTPTTGYALSSLPVLLLVSVLFCVIFRYGKRVLFVSGFMLVSDFSQNMSKTV